MRRLARRILELAVPSDDAGRSIVGDLDAEFAERLESPSRWQRLRAQGAYSWGAVTLAISLSAWRLVGGLSRRSSRSPDRRGPGGSVLDGLRHDLRGALRGLVRRPLFSLVAIVSVALGIGANTAIFTVVNTALLQDLPGIAAPEGVVEIGRTDRGVGFDTISYPEAEDLRGLDVFDEVAVFTFDAVSAHGLEGDDGGERWTAMYTSASYWSLLGVAPALGRGFSADEDTRPLQPVAILGHRVWRERFGGDPDVVGRVISISREPVTVVGVLGPEFGSHILAFEPEIWMPIGQSPEIGGEDAPLLANRGSSWLMAVARLSRDVSVVRAETAVGTLFERLEREFPQTNTERGARVVPLGPVPGAGRGGVAGFLGVLAGLVGLVLLIACSNVAGMLLAQGALREREIAVRLAMGSSRWQLVRQLLCESLLLFLVGGTAGSWLAVTSLRALSLSALPIPLRLDLDLRPDATVLLVAGLVTLLTGVAFGILPALQASRPNLVPALKASLLHDGGRGTRLRRAFVVAQVTASTVLLVTAGLFLRSLQEAGRVAKGFDPEHVVTTTVDLALEGYESEERGRRFQETVLERLAGRSDVAAAAFSTDLPLDLSASGTSVVLEADDSERELNVDFNRVSPDYFETLRIPRLEGRGFTRADRAGGERVAVVSRTFAERAFEERSALGRSFRLLDGSEGTVRIVGVVADVKNQSFTESTRPAVYLPLSQSYSPRVVLSARARDGGEGVPAAVREALLSVDDGLALVPVFPLGRTNALAVLPQRAAATVSSALGLVALILAGVGLYGVVAFTAARRAREIGIRMALGAERRTILAGVLRSALLLALPGVVLGVAGAAAIGRLAQSLLVGVGPGDPGAVLAAAGVLAGVVLLASLAPARRAAGVDPAAVLRSE